MRIKTSIWRNKAMKYKLNISGNTFAKVLRKGFGIEARDFVFIPEGEAGWLYSFIDKNNERFVVKIQKKPKKRGAIAYVALHNLGFTHMPQPVLGQNGKLWKRHWFNNYSVQEYIDLEDGSEVFALDDKYLPQLGKVLRDLHDVQLPSRIVSRLSSEEYEPQYLKKVQRHMRRLRRGGFSKYPEVQKVLMNNRDVIERLIEQAIADGRRLKTQELPLVLVHGDVHPRNILRSKVGELYLADWETAHLSHAEQDIMYFDDRQIGLISKGYGKDLLQNRLAIDYYRHHLRLRNIDFFAVYLGVKGKVPEDRQRGVEGLRETCELLSAMYKNNS